MLPTNLSDTKPLFRDEIAREKAGDTTVINSIVELPRMKPGDAVFFNSMVMNRLVTTCNGGCRKTNTRTLLLRYLDGERTKFREDVPSLSVHPQTRWCPLYRPWLSTLLGKPCRFHPGMPVRDSGLPIVIQLDKNKGGRRLVDDGLLNTDHFKLESWEYFLGWFCIVPALAIFKDLFLTLRCKKNNQDLVIRGVIMNVELTLNFVGAKYQL